MDLTEYARNELQLAGLFDENSDYDDGMLATATMELIEVFSKQGHSGFSAHLVIDLFTKLASYTPITPLTYSAHEWNDVGNSLWQNKRDSRVFSKDAGASHYRI